MGLGADGRSVGNFLSNNRFKMPIRRMYFINLHHFARFRLAEQIGKARVHKCHRWLSIGANPSNLGRGKPPVEQGGDCANPSASEQDRDVRRAIGQQDRDPVTRRSPQRDQPFRFSL
jgi:hypothetical protein